MIEPNSSKGRGRPPLSPAERRNRNFTFRSRGALREQLRTAAKTNERSVSEEIEHRLELSFRDDRLGAPVESDDRSDVSAADALRKLEAMCPGGKRISAVEVTDIIGGALAVKYRVEFL